MNRPSALLLMCLFVLSPNVFSATAPVAAPVDKPRVLLEEMKPLEDKRKILIPVKVEAKIQSLVTADIEGHITKILKPLGSVVKAGEVVLYLENKDPGFTYAAVPVRAPVAGVISQYWTSQMAKVIRGEKLFTVINPQSLKLSAEFPSADLSAVRAGMMGVFKNESQRDSDLSVRIVGISPLVDSRTGTASAELEFVTTAKSNAKSKQSLPPIGSVGQTTFEINQGSILLVPEASLIFQDGKPMVRVLKGLDQVVKKAIELGEQRDTAFIVKSGITQGEKIIVRSSRPLKEGDTIEVEKAEEKTR